jgi:hypothetical protein
MKRLLLVVATGFVLSGCDAKVIVDEITFRRRPCVTSNQPIERLTAEECEQKKADLEAAAAAQRAAEEERKKRDDAIAAEAIREEKARGYQRISLETFLLDGRELAARSAKISLRGSYLRDGNIELLFTNQIAVVKATRYPQVGRNEPRVGLLTDSATRESRQYLLKCQSDPGAAQLGCPITILGHATICALTGPPGDQQKMPCVAVDEGRPEKK